MSRCIIKLRSKCASSWCDKDICAYLHTDGAKIYKVYLVRLTNQKIAFVETLRQTRFTTYMMELREEKIV